ncbi:MAG: MFS transporter [Candidatus Omnitrophica bacterium]|nr:MFS transporter [Candidatus Omnitrophota bacterium]
MNKRFAFFNISLFLMEAVFAIEITASIIVSPNGVRSLGLNPELAGWIVNSYLYAAFISMALFYALRRFVIKFIPAVRCFYAGVGIFIVGNLICWVDGNAPILFTGRVIQGFGGALAMTGELWAACEYYREKITIPLFWAECGGAIGVIIGPALGGFIASSGSGTWRLLFLVNAVIGIITAITAWIALRRKPRTEAAFTAKPFHMDIWFIRLVLMQCAVAALAIGAEFLMSDYIQIKLDKSAHFVGYLAILASIGSIAGSRWMARYNNSFLKYTKAALAGLVIAHIGLAASLYTGVLVLASLPVFFVGICLGIANVAIYAKIAQKVQPVFFLPATLLYLIGMQIGNAVGVQTISLTESRGWTLLNAEIVMISVSIAPVLLIALYARFKRPSGEGFKGVMG